MYRFDPAGEPITAVPSNAHEARAVLEAQFLSMRVHGEGLGLVPKSIVVTGGASANPTVTQVLADVFNCTVHAVSQPDSASLGAALRAKHGYMCHVEGGTFVPFTDVYGEAAAHSRHVVATPSAHAEVYNDMLTRFRLVENRIVSQSE